MPASIPKILSKYLKVYRVTWVGLALTVYLFLAFLPMPQGIGVGLDPSWIYGISKAATEQLVWGRDIIFTYGPYGYLIQGAAWEETFLSIAVFQIGIHLALFLVTLAKLRQIKAFLPKILIVGSLLLTYLIGHFTTDYRIIFSFLIILSWDSILHEKYIRLWSLGLGIIAGFCLLTKFTVGICTFGALCLFLSGNIYNSIQTKSKIKTSILALIDSIVAATSISFLFLVPNYVVSLQLLLVCLTVATTFGIIAWFLQKHVCRVPLKIDKKSSNQTSNYSSKAAWSVFYWTYCFTLLVLLFSTSPSLINFLRGSFEISSGYSSAMSLVGSLWEVSFAVLEVFVVLGLLVALARERQLEFSLSLAFVLWIIFKHGFIRQGGHAVFFIFSVPILVALCISKIKDIRTVRLANFVYAYALAMAMIYYLVSSPFGNQIAYPNIFQLLNPTVVVSKAKTLFNLKTFQDNLNAISAANLTSVKLPHNAASLLNDKAVDIIPWEASVAAANHFSWKPRPIFQSYVAYTTFLDRTNLKSLSKEPRDYLLYQFASIDGRHPFFDEPSTLFHILCHYQISHKIPGFIETSSPILSNMMLLEKRQSNHCPTEFQKTTTSVSWKTPRQVSANQYSIIRSAVKIEYSLFGKLYKTLFRSPPVILKVRYKNGTENNYRIIPENSENGIIISHLPKNSIEALSFFQAFSTSQKQLPGQVESIEFLSENSLLYSNQIKLSLMRYELYGMPD